MFKRRGLFLVFIIILSFSVFGFTLNANFNTQNTVPEIVRPVLLKAAIVGEDPYIGYIFANDTDMLSGDDLIFSINDTSLFNIQSDDTNPKSEIKIGRMSFIPTIGYIGDFWFNVSVIDGYNAMDSEIVLLQIKLNNTAPNITSFYPLDENVYVDEGKSQIFNISWMDVDLPNNDNITIKWILDGVEVNVINGLTVPGNSQYTYNLGYSDSGAHNLTVYVVDIAWEFDLHYWNIVVNDVVQQNSGGGSSGGGGSGSCRSDWNCTDWSPCPTYEVQYRTCVDIKKCPRPNNKPIESQNCTFIPTPSCLDGVKNQGELGVDCGGPCNACLTCNDNIQNQGEEGVDCGGPCPRSCGQFAYLYPICGDNVCTGTDIFICYNDCKQSYWWIGIIALLVAVYVFYGYSKAGKLMKKFLVFEEKRKQKKKQEVPVVKAVKDIEAIRNELKKDADIMKTYFKFSQVLRQFFSDYFLIKYEFTYQDLNKELKDKKIDNIIIKKVQQIFDTLDSVEYGKYKLTKESFNNLIDRAVFVIGELTKVRVKIENNGGILSKFVQRINLKKDIEKDYLSKIIFELKLAMRQNNVKKATEIYKEAKSIYQKLPNDLKKNYQKDLEKLYSQLKGRLR